MNIHPIRNAKDYKVALNELSAYFDHEPEPGSEDGDRFEILATLVEAYEARHFPIEAPDPIEAIRFRMEQGGLTVKDLVPFLGGFDPRVCTAGTNMGSCQESMKPGSPIDR